ncbi:hypothetical protein [Nocardioides bruguierae]|uniref:Uncharacterized protein n=1 Tax=Nocardioides bruguierae TaxID=2945102 RepID=A0A9X2D7J1_9ACTN|nr:hypothetical protein [Nocardioides bruguierae]MCM0620667.1 hypothetical protein [Nocardioides bruguierae]
MRPPVAPVRQRRTSHRPPLGRALVGGVVTGGVTGYLLARGAGQARTVAMGALVWAARASVPARG